MTIPIPDNEQARLQALLNFEILDTEPEQVLDDLTSLAAHICKVPISLISLIDGERQWFKSRVGLEAQETPREQAFCTHAIMDSDLFVVTNATEDTRFANNPLVTDDPNIRFYAGMPLQTKDGYNLGTLCVIDRKPRQLTPDQKEALKMLSRQAIKHIEARIINKALQKKTAALATISEHLKQLHTLNTTTYESYLTFFENYLRVGCSLFGLSTGIISHINGETYTVKAVQSDFDINPGAEFELKNTYCAAVLNHQKTVFYNHVALLPHMKNHPAYQNLKLEAYISAPIYMNGMIYGTLNFSSTQPKTNDFSLQEQEIIEMMAQSVGHYLERQAHKQAEQNALKALSHSEKMFRSLLETAAVGVVIVKTDGLIHMVNKQTEHLFGFSHEDLIGQPLEMLLPADLRDRHRQHQSDYFITPTKRIMGANLKLIGQHKNGRHFPIEVSLSYTHLDEDLLVMAFIMDITRRQKAEIDLQQKTRQLAQSNQELEQFAYVVSHDLRAPLRAMYTYSQFLQEDNGDQLDEEGLEYLSGIQENAVHMEALVLGLLEFSRIGREQQKPVPVNLTDLLDNIISHTQLRQQAELHIPQQLPVITMHPMRGEQIFANLLTNAVKFRRPDHPSIVTLTCHDNEHHWEFSLTDNGIGIAENHIEKVFGVFQRLHTQTEYEGTGIGLAIVKKAIHELGGEISVHSTLGKGTTVTFTIAKTTEAT